VHATSEPSDERAVKHGDALGKSSFGLGGDYVGESGGAFA